MKLTKKQKEFLDSHPPDNYGSDGGIVWEDMNTIIQTKCGHISRGNNDTFRYIDDEMTNLYDMWMPTINYKRDKKSQLEDKKDFDFSKIPIHPDAKKSKDIYLHDLDKLFPSIQQVCPKFTKSDLEKVKKRVKTLYFENNQD